MRYTTGHDRTGHRYVHNSIKVLTITSYFHHTFITFSAYTIIVRRKRTLIILFHNFFLRTANLPICSPILICQTVPEISQIQFQFLSALQHARGILSHLFLPEGSHICHNILQPVYRYLPVILHSMCRRSVWNMRNPCRNTRIKP